MSREWMGENKNGSLRQVKSSVAMDTVKSVKIG